MGLIIVPAFALYVLISIIVVVCAIIFARKNKKNLLLWGGGAAFIMYNLLFWDLIPTIVSHKYYCLSEAGFWVYKTPEQWKRENPGILETLPKPNLTGAPDTDSFKDEEYKGTIYHLNKRFDWVVKHSGKFPINIWRREEELIDTKNKEVLARYIDFTRSQKSWQAGFCGWKMWLYRDKCTSGHLYEDKMRKVTDNFYGEGN